MHPSEYKEYTAEFNRAVGDHIAVWMRKLKRSGLEVSKVPHLTAVLIERPASMTWKRFKQILRSVLQPRRGSVLLFSHTTGRSFYCSNKGNMPGRFQRIGGTA
ncbi:hypothetical protein LPLAFNJD_LOCUS1950 [Methylorubrum aminovorans]